MAETRPLTPGQWRRLSPWAIAHFAQKAIVQNLQVVLIAGISAYFGTSRMRDAGAFPWVVPLGVVVIVLVSATITYLFYRYRVVEDAVQVKRGALFKQHLNIPFARIQNINIEHPFYFRPLGRVTLKIDGAGSKAEEVNVAAVTDTEAQAIREFIMRRRALGRPLREPGAEDPAALRADDREAPFYSRSVGDLVLHGLTNNRSAIAVAAIIGTLVQSGTSPVELMRRLGIDFDVVIGGWSVVHIAVVVVLSFIAAVGAIALLSVLVSVVTYYGFTLSRSGDSLTIERGLLTRHEIHVKKSRIQTIYLRQDWLDRLLGRYNVILERITHSTPQADPMAAQSKRILVPSMRASELPIVTDEILPGCRPSLLAFTPVHVRWFYKNAAIVSLAYLVFLGAAAVAPDRFDWIMVALLVVWPLHVVLIWLRFKAGGLAVDGNIVVVRSGAIGIDYRLFAADKIQNVTHVQSLLMRRHGLSSLDVRTASTWMRVPCMPTDFIRKVVDYCAFRAESSTRSWM